MGDDLPGNGFQRAFTAAEQGRAPYVILTVLCFLLFGIGLATLPPTDRDEARFMQATKQMIESGDYVHINLQDVPRTKKPVGIHWLQAAAVRLSGQPLNRAWPYRLPSALGAWLAVLMTCACGRRLFGERAGLVAGLMMATTPLAVAEAHLAKTDAMLLGLSTLAMSMLARVYVAPTRDRTDSSRTVALAIFWLAVGGAILIKGPVVLLVVGATVTTLAFADKNRAVVSNLKPALGIPLAILIVAPWLVLLAKSGQSGFVGAAFREDLLPKLIGGQEGHGAAPGTYLVTTVLTAWPWSLLIPVALVATWPARSLPGVRFCLAWLVPAWLAFEAVPTKLPHYILPLLPAAALLLGAAVQDGRRWRGVLTRPAARGWRGLFALISIALGVGLVWAARLYGVPPILAVPIAASATVAAAGLCFVVVRLGPTPSVTLAVGIAAVFCVVTIGGILPSAGRLWISTRIAAEVNRRAHAGPIALVGYHEPSAVFLLGTDTRLTDAPGAAATLLANPGAVAVIDAPHVAAVMEAVAEGGGQAHEVAKIDGYNYARGSAAVLSVVMSSQ